MEKHYDYSVLKKEKRSYEYSNAIALKCEEIIRHHIDFGKNLSRSYLIAGVSHSLMKYVSNFILQRDESENFNFPFLNAQFMEAPYRIQFGKEKARLKYAFLFRDWRFVELGLHFNDLNILEKIICKFLSFVLGFKLVENIFKFLQVKKYWMPDEKGIDLLDACLDEISAILKLVSGEADIFKENFINYTKSFEGYSKTPICKYFYCAGLMDPHTAYRASIYRELDLRVHNRDHGNATIFMRDEPFVRLTETLLPTHYHVNGEVSAIKNIIKKNRNSFSSIPKIIGFENSKKSTLFAKNIVSSKNNKLLYCPTGTTGNNRYCPFHQLSDKSYILWQQILIDSLIDRGFKIAYKKHPKNKTVVNLSLSGTEVIEDNFTSLNIGAYRAVVFDYVSTAYNLSTLTSCNIWYFDIGLRKMFLEFYEPFKTLGIESIDFEADIKSQVNRTISVYSSLNEPICQKFYMKGVSF